jgi:hypothetical protein
LIYGLPNNMKGDAPTPLRVTVTPVAGSVSTNSPGTSAWLIGCVSGDTPGGGIVDIGTGDGFTAGTGTAAPTTDANYWGGSYRAVTIGAATPNLLTRLSGQFPAPGVGRYKIYVRTAYTAAAAKTLQFRLNLQAAGGSAFLVRGNTVSATMLATDADRRLWVDLGEFQLPTNFYGPTNGGGGILTGATFLLDIGTADGSASAVRIDSFLIVPVDGDGVTQVTMLRMQGPAGAPLQAGATATLDGVSEQTWMVDTTTGNYMYGDTGPTLKGQFPIVDPAVGNILYVVALDSGQGTSASGARITDLNAQAPSTSSYYPRYLHLGDGT